MDASQNDNQRLLPPMENGSTHPAFTVNGIITSSKPRLFLNGKIKPAVTCASDVPHIVDDGALPGGARDLSGLPSMADRTRLTIYNKLKFMTSTTSFDGLRFMYGGPRTIIWMLIFILSVIAMAIVLWYITDIYLARNTTFKRVKYFPDTINFPAITLCNHNPYYAIQDFYSLSNETQVAILYEFYRKDRLVDVNTSRLLEIINDSFAFDIFTEHFNQSVNIETVLREHGHKLEDGLLLCSFNDMPCGIQDFTEIVTAYGLCYTFNLDSTWNISSAGTSHGLSLVINIEQSRYMYYTSHTAGLQVFVHPQDEYPYSGEFHGFSVPPGFETQVAISLTNTKLQEPPYGQCGERTIHDPNIFPCTVAQSLQCPQLIKRYTRQRCLDECEALYQNRRCGCKVDYLPGGDIRVCNLNELVNCLLQVTNQFAEVKNSVCDCPVECHRVQYNTKLSQSYFSANHTSQEANRSDYLSLLLYLDQLEYTEVTEKPEYGLFRFIADIGNHVALFTGAGFLTFFELFELCFHN